MDLFFDKVGRVGSLFWLPAVLWLAYFFWSKFLSYPQDLEKRIKQGKVWLYMPRMWQGRRKAVSKAGAAVLFFAGVVFFASSIYFLAIRLGLPGGTGENGFAVLTAGAIIAIVLGLKIRDLAVSANFNLQQDRYFQLYTQIAGQSLTSGVQVSDAQLLNRAQWQHQNDLRQADKQGRLLPFLKGEAKL